MLLSLTTRPATAAGLTLLALWLGWVGAAFAGLWTPQRSDPARMKALVTRLRPALPTMVAGRPGAVLLDRCACAGDSLAWQQVQAVLQQHAGSSHSLPAEAVAAYGAAGIALLVFDAEGRPVYAGPLQPLLPACGRGITQPGLWLPGLLDGSQPPLLLSPACSCR